MFKLDEGALDLILVLLNINLLLEWKSGLYGLLGGSSSNSGLDRSDRSGVTFLTGLVRLELLRSAMNHVPFFCIQSTLYFLEAFFDFLRVALPHRA